MTTPLPRAAVRREELRIAREQAHRLRARRFRVAAAVTALLAGVVVGGTAVAAGERPATGTVPPAVTGASAPATGESAPGATGPVAGPELAGSQQRHDLTQLRDDLEAALVALDPVLADELRLRAQEIATQVDDVLLRWPDAVGVVVPDLIALTSGAGSAGAEALGLPLPSQPTALDAEALALALADVIEALPEIVVTDGVTTIDGIVVANKTFALPDTYDPGLRPEVVDAFAAMKVAAAEDGITLYIRSGYRTYVDQLVTYRGYSDKHGAAVADTFSARPGHSEHQTGLSIDVNDVTRAFVGTPEAIWVAEHAHEFGFVVRFPDGKEQVTGYSYEPWHLRYLGTELATTLTTEGLTLEEHLGVTSRY